MTRTSAIVAGALTTLCLVSSVKSQTHQFIKVTPQIPKLIAAKGFASLSAFADMNGDGWMDATVGSLGTYFNRGDGSFRYQKHTWKYATTDSITMQDGCTVDVDGDGDLDFAVAVSAILKDPYSQNPKVISPVRNYLWMNTGNNTFVEDSTGRMPANAKQASVRVVSGDFDGDGDADLFFGTNGGQNELYLNDGKGRFKDVTATHLPKDSMATRGGVEVGDLDGDGDLDIVTANGFYSSNKQFVATYINNGKGKFSFGRINGIANWHAGMALGDIDGDGDLDAVFVTPAFYSTWKYPTLVIYRNDGKGNLTRDSKSMPADPLHSGSFMNENGWLDLADLDGDGDLDIMESGYYWQAKLFTNRRVMLNDGTGKFSINWTLLKNVNSNYAPFLVDVDDDADIDLVYTYPKMEIYYNTHRQLFTDHARLGKTSTAKLYAQKDHIVYLALSLVRKTTRLPPWGRLHLDPAAMAVLPPQIFKTAGSKDTHFQVPNNPALLGLRVYSQALDFDIKKNTAHFTGMMIDTVAR